MAFTTWTELYNDMLDKLANGDATIGSISTANGKSITYKSNKEFLELLKFVELKASGETGAFVPRTYAKQGGRAV